MQGNKLNNTVTQGTNKVKKLTGFSVLVFLVGKQIKLSNITAHHCWKIVVNIEKYIVYVKVHSYSIIECYYYLVNVLKWSKYNTYFVTVESNLIQCISKNVH